jgi:hypothetical protein
MQTSIEWLIEQLSIYGDKAFNKEITLGEYHIKKNELIEQAKEMHKQEIIDAYFSGGHNMKNGHYIGMKEYYEITFKKD